MGMAVFASESGQWAACRKCTGLVRKRDWKALTNRAVKEFVKRHRISKQEVTAVRAQLAEVDRLFAEHMKP